MGNKKFEKFCLDFVLDYYLKRNHIIVPDDVYIVWICKTLQNNKALVSTNVHDGMYFEITHNGDKNETYVDVYKKQENILVKGE